MWECPKCKSSEMRFMVSLIVSAPMDFYGNLGKSNLKRKEVHVLGADWPNMDMFCNACGWSRRVEKENEEHKNAES